MNDQDELKTLMAWHLHVLVSKRAQIKIFLPTLMEQFVTVL